MSRSLLKPITARSLNPRALWRRNTARHFSSHDERVPNLDALVKPDPREPGSFSHLDTQLARAAKRSNPDRIAKLLALGARTERAFFDGRSALAWSAAGAVTALRFSPSGFLVLGGPDFPEPQKQRKRDQALRCLELLAQAFQGQDQLRNASGATALAEAAARARHPQGLRCLEILLPISNPHALDDFGRDPLMAAARARDRDAVEMLLAFSDPRRKTPEGHDALAMCAGFAPRRVFADLNSRRAPQHGRAPDVWSCVRLLAPLSDLWNVDDKGRDCVAWARKEDQADSPSQGLGDWLEAFRAAQATRSELIQSLDGADGANPRPAAPRL